MRKRFLIFPIFTLLSSFLYGQDWQVSPMLYQLTISRGDTISRFINVNNESDKIKNFMIYKKEWHYTEDGKEPELEPGMLPRGCANWISIAPQRFSVDPKSSRSVRYTIIVPKDLDQPGSYWTALYVEPADAPAFISKMSGQGATFEIAFQIRAKIQIYLTLDGAIRKEGEITNIDVVFDSIENNVIVQSTFVNSGNMWLKCSGTVEIRNDMGHTVASFDLPLFNCFPDDKRVVKATHPLSASPGEYSALVVVDFKGDYLVAGEAFFDI
jgi:hypothetical protein